MVFSSISFLFFFLPIVVTVYFFLPVIKLRNLFLLIMSLCFYTMGEGKSVIILLISLALNYILGFWVDKARQVGNYLQIRLAMTTAVLINIGLLAYFKYTTFFKVEISNESSDLINMMGLNSTITDRRLSLVKKTENLAFEVESGIFYQPELPIEKRPFATELKNSNTPKILMFHDSFASSLRPFLSETFSRIVYVWEDKLDNKIVKKERPNIVIQEIVERKLMTDPGI